LKRKFLSKRLAYGVIFLGGFLAVVSAAESQSPQAEPLVHQPALSVQRGEAALIAARARPDVEWVIVFWRAAGADDFVSQKLLPSASGDMETRIDTGTIGAQRFEYYFAYKIADTVSYLPANPPDTLFETNLISGPSGTGKAAPAGHEVEPGPPPAAPFPIRFSSSLDTTINEKSESSVPNPGHTENLDLTYDYKKDDFGLDILARASYSNHLLPGASKADLPNMRISLTKGSHSIRAGDLTIAESEFASGCYGSRGLEYVFDDQSLYLHLFTAGTQPLLGFKGIGIPKAASSLFGGAAGFTLAKIVTIKAVYFTGRDDPTLAANGAGISEMMNKRAGDLIAVVGEARLFKNALDLSAEYAHSSYDGDTTDNSGKVPGAAFRVGATLNLGLFDARIAYHDIGRDFNTVAQPFFLNDRRTLEAGAGVTIKNFRLSGSWDSEQNNTSDDPAVATSRSFLTNFNLSWQFRPGSNLVLGFGTNRQDARLNDNPVLQGNLLRTGISAGLDIGISPSLRFTLNGQGDDIKSADNPSVEGHSLGGNLGVFAQFQERFVLMATFGLTRTTNKLTNASALMLMANLNGEAFLARKLFSINAMGSVVRYDLDSGGTTNSTNLDAGLNLYLGQWIKIGQVMVSVRADVVHGRFNGQDVRDDRIFAKVDISL